jgi:hypothetical protein
MMLNAPEGASLVQHMNLYAIPTLAHMRQNAYAYGLPGGGTGFFPIPIKRYSSITVC